MRAKGLKYSNALPPFCKERGGKVGETIHGVEIRHGPIGVQIPVEHCPKSAQYSRDNCVIGLKCQREAEHRKRRKCGDVLKKEIGQKVKPEIRVSFEEGLIIESQI